MRGDVKTVHEGNMSQLITHNKCKYYGYKKCPHINNDIMRQATQDTPEYCGGKPIIVSFPTNKEIDEICGKCGMFTPLYKEFYYGC